MWLFVVSLPVGEVLVDGPEPNFLFEGQNHFGG